MSRTLLRLLLRLPKEQYKDVTAENFTVKPRFNPIRPVGGGGGGGGRGWQKVPAPTLNVNNFFNVEANATKLSDFS